MFRQHFDRDVLEGDRIHCTVDDIEFIATVEYDCDAGPPDEECDGFWPSRSDLKSDAAFERAYGQAALTMQAWKDEEWRWGGVIVTAGIHDSEGEWIELVGKYEHALWGIEVNYPVYDKRRRPNTYLREVANELLAEARVSAKAALVEHIASKFGRAA